MSNERSEVGPEPGRSSSTGPATVRIHVGPEQRPSIQIQISEDEEGSSSMSSVFTLCNSAIGAGVLSLPYAFRYSGVQARLAGPWFSFLAESMAPSAASRQQIAVMIDTICWNSPRCRNRWAASGE